MKATGAHMDAKWEPKASQIGPKAIQHHKKIWKNEALNGTLKKQ